MRNKKIVTAVSLAICTAILSSVCCSCSGQGKETDSNIEKITANTQYVLTQKQTPKPVYSIGFDVMGGKDVMPVGGWWGPYNPKYDTINGIKIPDYVTDYYFGQLKDVGINFTVVSPETYDQNSKSVYKALDLSAKYDMGYFVYDPVVSEVDKLDTMQSRLDLYMSHPACIGVHSIDEPTAKSFDELAKVYEKYSQLGYNNQYLYTNMLPNYAGGFSGVPTEPISYETYLRSYMDKVQPGFLSFDHYPFRRPDTGTDNMMSYFNNLSIIRTIANDYKVPFWPFIQLGGQWNDSGVPRDIVYPLFPSEAETYWNINTSLAYGAKAIEYFTLFQPLSWMATVNGFNFEHCAMFGAAGNKTGFYHFAKKANKQIAAIDHVLMNAANEGVIAVGEKANFNIQGPELIKSGAFRQLKGVTCVKDGDSAIVGCFDYFGGTALYIVNYSVKEKSKFILNFDDKYGYDIIQRGRKVSVAGKDIALTVEAGEGVLVVLR